MIALTGNGWPTQAKRSHKFHEEYAKKTLYAYMPCAGLQGAIGDLLHKPIGSLSDHVTTMSRYHNVTAIPQYHNVAIPQYHTVTIARRPLGNITISFGMHMFHETNRINIKSSNNRTE